MSNCEVVTLPPLELEPYQLREVLRCLLHTIIFCRALGPVRPREVDLELFDVTYVSCGDLDIEERVDERIGAFQEWVRKHPGRPCQVSLSFYETRKKQSWSLIGGTQEERLYWEQWLISLTVLEAFPDPRAKDTPVLPSAAREQRLATLQGALLGAVAAVARHCGDKREHLPPVATAAVQTFPFELTISGEGGTTYGYETVKRLLLNTTPPSVLS